jgi:hypothetical protein
MALVACLIGVSCSTTSNHRASDAPTSVSPPSTKRSHLTTTSVRRKRRITTPAATTTLPRTVSSTTARPAAVPVVPQVVPTTPPATFPPPQTVPIVTLVIPTVYKPPTASDVTAEGCKMIGPQTGVAKIAVTLRGGQAWSPWPADTVVWQNGVSTLDGGSVRVVHSQTLGSADEPLTKIGFGSITVLKRSGGSATVSFPTVIVPCG